MTGGLWENRRVSRSSRASIVIPAWNGAAYLDACLGSLLLWLAPEHDVIVVDDGSTDNTAEIVARHIAGGRVRLIRNPANTGFARSVNRGLAEARGDILILLNQDTISPRDWLTSLLAAMASDDRIGIAGCRLLYPDGRVQHAGGHINLRGEGAHFTADPPADSSGLADVAFVTGACLAISRASLSAIGLLDEQFGRAYFEDVDWCFRAKRAGYRVVYSRQAELIHEESSASAGTDFDGMVRFHGNRLRFVIKHFDLDALSGSFLAAERTWLRGLGPGGERLVAAMHRVYFRNLLNLAQLVRARETGGLGPAQDGDVDTIGTALVLLRATAPF